MISTEVQIQTFLKWGIYSLGTRANDRNLVPQVTSVTSKKNVCAIKHENIIKRDCNV